MSATAPSTSIALADRSAVRADRPATRSDLCRALALFGPLLLFVHGILGWVDGRDGATGTGWFPTLTGLTLVGSVVALALLTAELGEQAGRGVLATIAVVVGAFGAGAIGAVTIGRLLDVLTDDLPVALAAGGPVLLAVGLGLLLLRLVLVGRLPASAGAVALVGAAVIAVPWELLPLGALVLLVGLSPLVRR